MPRLLFFLIIIAAAASFASAADYIWWEGEAAADTNFPKVSAFSVDHFVKAREVLSGGNWLSNSGKRVGEEAYARWRVEVPEDGEYHLWCRKFWKHGPFGWRFGQGNFQRCGKDVALADDSPIAPNIVANWVYLGKVALKKGNNPFEIRLLAQEGEELTAAFDCFLLTKHPFMARGKLKPDEKSAEPDDGFFAYDPGIDRFTDEALLDLRRMNEKTAGEGGFLKRQGNHFALGSGQPVRFWGVNIIEDDIGQDRPSIDYLARKLAKMGVNMIRYHGRVHDYARPAVVDPKLLDNLLYLIAAMKREGIYTDLSFYFPLWFDMGPRVGIAGYEKTQNKKPFTLLYFDAKMQEIHRGWIKTLLTTTNPYTGLTLAKDAALGLIEINNEDSFFFWTFNHKLVPDTQWRQLEQLFGDWLIKRYGSIDKALAAWGASAERDDDSAVGRAVLFEAWNMTKQGIAKAAPDRVKRIGDQVRFLSAQQRGFYLDTVKYVREELGAGCLISPSNWTVSDPVMLDALERYSYTAGDVIDRHGYFSPKVEGEGAGYSVRVGHRFQSIASVLNPEMVPLGVSQVADYPQIISEINWQNPNRYRADATFLTSAYSGLQGTDGIFFFCLTNNFVSDPMMTAPGVSAPSITGTFPASALLFRRGDVAEAPAVVYEALKLDDLFAMKGSAAATPDALDPLRKRDVPEGGSANGAIAAFDPLAYFVGPVIRSYDEAGGKSSQRDLSKFIDREHKTIASLTGELHWDYGNGIVTINTPRSQGAAGFLSKRKIDLKDITIESANEFSSVLAIALDDQPLATSRKILIQVMTQEQPAGFTVENNTIASLGRPPLEVKQVVCKIFVKGMADAKAIALDENFYAAKKEAPIRRSDQGPIIELPPDAMYTIIQR